MPKANQVSRQTNKRVALPPKVERKEIIMRPVVGDPAGMMPLAKRVKSPKLKTEYLK